jgi:hypothetical protein
MSKNYQLSPSGTSAGRMICCTCGKKIDNKSQDFSIHQKTLPHDDWKYVTEHRKCAKNDTGWKRLEKAIHVREAEINRIVGILDSLDESHLVDALSQSNHCDILKGA